MAQIQARTRGMIHEAGRSFCHGHVCVLDCSRSPGVPSKARSAFRLLDGVGRFLEGFTTALVDFAAPMRLQRDVGLVISDTNVSARERLHGNGGRTLHTQRSNAAPDLAFRSPEVEPRVLRGRGAGGRAVGSGPSPFAAPADTVRRALEGSSIRLTRVRVALCTSRWALWTRERRRRPMSASGERNSAQSLLAFIPPCRSSLAGCSCPSIRPRVRPL